MFIVLHTDTCCRVAAGGDVVWHGSITSPDVTTFSASVHQISGSMKYLKHVSFSVMSYKLSVTVLSVHLQVVSVMVSTWYHHCSSVHN